MNPRTQCPSCSAEVVRCIAIVADLVAGALTQDLIADPAPLAPEEGLLLHVGESYEDGRWVVAPLGTRSGVVLSRQMQRPHAHRPHACAVVPAAWLEQDLAASA